jgi:hypothetical protein
MRSLALSFVLLAAACAHSPFVAPLTPPAAGGRAWFEARSRHFLVRTDIGDGEARRMCEELERIHAAFADLVVTTPVEPRGRVTVVVFARREDYMVVATARKLPQTAGLFTRNLNDIDESPTVITSGGLDNHMRELLQHELSHRFLRLQMPDPPTWLNEGLAEYNATLQLHDGQAWFGQLPVRDRHLFVPGAELSIGLGSVSVADLPSVATLLAATPDTFYEHSETPVVAEHPLSYHGSWLLVHMLSAPRGGYRARLDAYLALLSQGTPRSEAWARAFAGVSIAQLEHDYQQHMRDIMAGAQAARDAHNDTWQWFATTPYHPHAGAPVDEVQPLDDAAVRILFAQLLPWNTPEGLARAQRELAAARAEASERADVHYWSGLLARRAHKASVDGEDDFVAATKAAPREARYRQALLLLHEARLGANEGATLEALEPEVHQLARVAQTAQALNLVADYYSQRNQPDIGMPFALRAVGADPSCASCYATLAKLRYEHRQFVEAVAAQEHACGLLPEGLRVDEFVRLLDRYRHAAASEASSTLTPAASGAP